MSLRDQIQKAIENAPVATGGSFVQYGKLTCAIFITTFHGKGEKPTRKPYTEDAEIDERNQVLEVEFVIDVKELNPSLNFDNWTRRIQIKNSGSKVKTDWAETVKPALERVFGAKWVDVVSGTLKPYVECEQADSQFVRRDAEKDYGVPKILRAFKSRDECAEARTERYGAPVSSSSDEEADEELGIPAEVISQAKGLKKSIKNAKKLREIFETTEPFSDYDVDAIMAEIE